ncbi:hypothetical protein [Sulfurimonas sp.]|uniref:hypothetical protein n=1 Tax=Sulfurimonas sp. TaxID=2022749 RepID=UPI0025DFDB3D|nr:hypothetical protein [Sulfurimonas sp.]
MKISKILSLSLMGAVAAISIAGCSGANVHAQMRVVDSFDMETKCVELDMRDQSEMDEVLKTMAGWRVFYISEYTTDNKIGTDGSMCFERKRQ